tara:strand:+ start:100 stop:783 length:684 start_codon:yes stop_codon:yes gene_type:complete
MRIDIITTHPKMFSGAFEHSILKRAQDKKIVKIEIHDLRDFSNKKSKSIDDYQYGGGAGMVMNIEPIDKCIGKLKKERDYDEIIYFAPDGENLSQKTCNIMSSLKNIILLCGHYKGVDQRVRDHLITREISIGDYVLTGGEIPAMVLCDSIIRLIPGVISDETSALFDSFQDNIISHPVYTRPEDYKGVKVPKILLSGHKKRIEEWRMEQSIKNTKEKRPNLFNNNQ